MHFSGYTEESLKKYRKRIRQAVDTEISEAQLTPIVDASCQDLAGLVEMMMGRNSPLGMSFTLVFDSIFVPKNYDYIMFDI